MIQPVMQNSKSAMGRCCRQSRKSNDAKNLANGDFWTTPPLRCSVAPIRRSVVVFLRCDVVPTSLCTKRIRSFRIFLPPKTFSTASTRSRSPCKHAWGVWRHLVQILIEHRPREPWDARPVAPSLTKWLSPCCMFVAIRFRSARSDHGGHVERPLDLRVSKGLQPIRQVDDTAPAVFPTRLYYPFWSCRRTAFQLDVPPFDYKLCSDTSSMQSAGASAATTTRESSVPSDE